MGYHENPGMVRVDRFKENGKWYDSYAIDMSPYYDYVSVFDAVASAWIDRYTWKKPLQPYLNPGWSLVCLEPYHRNSFPVMLKLEHFQRMQDV